MATAGGILSTDLHTVKVQLLLMKDRLVDDQDVSSARKVEYRKYIADIVDSVSNIMNKENTIRKGFMEEFGKVREDCARIIRNKSMEIEDIREKLFNFVRTVHSKYAAQAKTAEEAIKILSNCAGGGVNKPSEFNKKVKEFLKQQTDVKNFRMRISSQLSSVKKNQDNSISLSKNQNPVDFSICQDSKQDEMRLLSCFEKGSTFLPDSDRKGQPIRSQNAHSKDQFSFKEGPRAAHSPNKDGEQPSSDVGLPDFTMESATNKEVDSARIADQYEPFASRQRALLNIELEDVMGARSLPISLKGSSTFM